ncbi:hypothetical protein D3C86_1974340 [compost metagenome]
MFDELGHFTSALTNQADDKNVGIGVVDQHVDQRGLARTGGGKNADALTDAAGQQAIDDPNAGTQRFRHRAPLLVRRRVGIHRIVPLSNGH